MIQLPSTRHLTRTHAAVVQRIAAYLERPARISLECEICPRFVQAAALLSDRGWCRECEREFAQVMASPQLVRVVTRIR